jgi:hypothetical protein
MRRDEKMADRVYSVTGVVKKGHMREFEILVFASSAAEAKRYALGEWKSSGGEGIGHLFWLTAKRTDKPATLSSEMWHKIGESINGHWVEYA